MTPEGLDTWAGAAARRLGVTLEPGDVPALLALERLIEEPYRLKPKSKAIAGSPQNE